MSAAKLLKENQNNQNATYSFVNFKENQNKPYIKMKNFWHPFLSPDNVITNNVKLG